MVNTVGKRREKLINENGPDETRGDLWITSGFVWEGKRRREDREEHKNLLDKMDARIVKRVFSGAELESDDAGEAEAEDGRNVA